METVDLGGVTSLPNDNTFRDCTNLTSIIVREPLNSPQQNAFSGCSSLVNIYITDVGKWCSSSFSTNAAAYSPCRANTLTKNLYLNGTKVTSITVPNSITSLPNHIFTYCDITSIILPSGLTSIGVYAFKSSKLTAIRIPNSVTTIGNACFHGCYDMEIFILGSAFTGNTNTETFRALNSLKTLISLNSTPPPTNF